MMVTDSARPASATDDGPSHWHSLSVSAAWSRTESGPSGLSHEEARRRHLFHGPNEIVAVERTPPWQTLAAQFANTLILILIGATVISAVTGHPVEAVVIAVIVLFSVLLGFAQEFRAGRALDALRQLAAPTARVIREGQRLTIPAREIVPGDLMILHEGDRVPADARIVSATNLSVDEAALTGESATVHKTDATLEKAWLPAGDRRNMVFAGTLVAAGRGKALVVDIGKATEFGAIAEMVQNVAAGRTPLQDTLDRAGRVLAKAAAAIVVTIVALGLWRGEALLDMLMFGIALGVAVVPEALPAVVTISLAIGVRRMVKRHALVRRLAVVEALGTVSVICTDKTGTLTRNEMTVRLLYVNGRTICVTGAGYDPAGGFTDDQGVPIRIGDDEREALIGAVLSSDARLQCRDGQWHIDGDPTEGALVVAASKAGIEQADVNQRFPRVEELPFTGERRRMTTLHVNDDGVTAYSKGAADVIIASADRELRAGIEQPLSDVDRGRLRQVERAMAAEGLRVLAIARKLGAAAADAEGGMTLLGLVGMMDPPRVEARDAVRICKSAGITPVMITGDHPLTARRVATELGMLTGRVTTGAVLQRLSDDQLHREIGEISVYARVSPADKLRVISAWQRRGAVVAMTGDGINDAPALKKADVGVAMGTGTDVSKEAAGMTLLDDNFASIVGAIEEGRVVFANIRKYLGYLLSANVGEVVLMASAVALGAPLPLAAVQILYVNLATDGLPALALAVEPAESDLMQRPPRDPRQGIFTPALVTLIAIGGLWSGLVTLSLFLWLLQTGRPVAHAMTLVFTSLVLIEFFKAFIYRSLGGSMFARPFGNPWLNAAMTWELLLLACVLYVPALQTAFGTFSVTWTDWLMVVAVASSIVPVLELVKFAQRRSKGGLP